MIPGSLTGLDNTVLIPATNFYCPYPVLWLIMLACMGFGIFLGYKKVDTWRQLHLHILNLLTG